MFDTLTAFAMKVHSRNIIAEYRLACLHRMDDPKYIERCGATSQ